MGNADDRFGAVGGSLTVHLGILVVVGKGEADMGGELDGEEGVRSTCVDQGANVVAEDGGVDVEERGDVNGTGGKGMSSLSSSEAEGQEEEWEGVVARRSSVRVWSSGWVGSCKVVRA